MRRVWLDRARARDRRPRHVVLVGALAVRDARLAGRDARARALLPRERQLDGARDHPPLGEPHDLDGPRGVGRRAVHRRDHPLDGARARRPAHVEEPRHRHRPDGADRGVRRRRDPLRAAQDLVDAGRALLVRRDRGGAEARDQALERRAADPRRTPRASAGARRRRSLEERWILARLDAARAELEDAWARFDFSDCRLRRSTTSPSTTSATGTRRRSSRGSTTATRRRSRLRSRRSSGCSRSCIP